MTDALKEKKRQKTVVKVPEGFGTICFCGPDGPVGRGIEIWVHGPVRFTQPISARHGYIDIFVEPDTND